jgi:hypothetical protein
MTCYRVYPGSKNHRFLCPICHELPVQIDDLFAATIAELNKKGYKTLTCCSGHVNASVPNCYIRFEEKFLENLLPPFIGYCPYGEYNKVTKTWTENRTTLRKYFDLPTKEKLVLNAKRLFKWAQSLPAKE